MATTRNQNAQNPEENRRTISDIFLEERMNMVPPTEQNLKKQIQNWLKRNPYRELLFYVRSRVMGQEDVSKVTANVYNYLENVSDPVTGNMTRGNRNNMILAAPSGSGKTETYRALKDYFSDQIPALIINIIDVSSLTPTGYRGAEPSSIVAPFIRLGEQPIGIVFLDEFDKMCTPSYSANHGDVHLEVQNNLLTIIEGARIETKRGYVNTSNLLFIGTGSFDLFRKRRENEKKTSIGFQKQEYAETEHSAPITRENIISAGGSYELIGRFSYIINYHPLDQETVINIIRRECEDISADFKCEINMEPQALTELCEKANSKFGCRLLGSLIRDSVLNAFSEALESDDNGDVLVVKIESLNSYTYYFRNFNQQELLLQNETEWDDGVKMEDELSCERMSFEERLEALIRAKQK